jgi:hypothetical protein
VVHLFGIPYSVSHVSGGATNLLSGVHRELDLVTTAAGDLVVMVHCNNGAKELNAWVGLFAQFAEALGIEVDTSTIFLNNHVFADTRLATTEPDPTDVAGFRTFSERYQTGPPVEGAAVQCS